MDTDKNHNENPSTYITDVITITNMSYYEKSLIPGTGFLATISPLDNAPS